MLHTAAAHSQCCRHPSIEGLADNWFSKVAKIWLPFNGFINCVRGLELPLRHNIVSGAIPTIALNYIPCVLEAAKVSCSS